MHRLKRPIYQSIFLLFCLNIRTNMQSISEFITIVALFKSVNILEKYTLILSILLNQTFLSRATTILIVKLFQMTV